MRIAPRLGVLSVALSCGFLVLSARAASINVTSPFETDQTATTGNTHTGSNSGTGNAAIFYVRVGERTTGSPGTEVSGDLPFLLPAIPAGKAIATANLEVSTVNQTSNKPVANSDLYGIKALTAAPPDGSPAANGGTIANTPYYFSGAGPDTNGVALLQGNFLDPTVGTTAHNYTSSDFASFIQSLYDNDANAAGKYVTLRLSYDSTTFQPAQRYEVLTSQGSDQPQSGAVTPVLTITFTPEPASLGLLAFGALSLMSRRRRMA